jgi:UDP-N-acetylglucosamine 2-epimerase (non-hydrolysing)
MKKILSVFGTRPEAIKMAPLVLKLRETPGIQSALCITAQHREMLDQVLSVFDIKAEYDLNIMKPGQDLFDITSSVLLGICDVLSDFKPDVVLVHGDTTTSFAVSLAAFYKNIQIGHVEAGLRTYDLHSPFPEEANRQITDILADWYFTPTEQSALNLRNEKHIGDHIFITGNTVIDALLLVKNKIESSSELQNNLHNSIAAMGYTITGKHRIILITGHRRENFGVGFINICESLRELAEKNRDIDIVYPVHLNPNVQKPVYELLSGTPNIYLVKPLEYMQFIYLMIYSYLVLTDSGGIQEEAPSLGKPVLVMRDTTERPEAVLAGTVKLVGINKESIIRSVQDLLDSQSAYEQMAKAVNPYGDGFASDRIIKILLSPDQDPL